MLYYVFRAHKPCEWSLSSGHGTDVMDQWIHCLVLPDVIPTCAIQQIHPP